MKGTLFTGVPFIFTLSLLQNSYFADQGKFLGLSAGSIHDTKNREKETDNAEQTLNHNKNDTQKRDPGEDVEYTKDYKLNDSKNKSLVAVETCVLRILGSEKRNKHKPGKVCKNTHSCVVLNILRIKLNVVILII